MMKMKLWAAVAAVMLFPVCQTAWGQTPYTATDGVLNLTLDEAIELALDENPTIKVADEDIRLKEMAKMETTMSLLPEANLSGSYQRTIKKQTMVMNDMQFKVGIANSYNGGLTVSLPVFAPALYKSM